MPFDVDDVPAAPNPVTVPPEVMAEANRTFDEQEVMDAIREIRDGGGFKLEEFMPELEKLVPASGALPRAVRSACS